MNLNSTVRGLLAAFFATLSCAALRAALPAGFTDITVATGFTNASCLAVAPDGRILVGQQNGVIRMVKNGGLLPAPFLSLGLPYPTSGQDERALVAIAFDPGFATNSFVYLHYTAGPSTTVTQRISRVIAGAETAVAGSETVLIESDSFTGNREVGGGLAFGPDGKLYIGIGQGGNTANGQVTNTLFSKILRINSDGTIPADNPFPQNTGKNRAAWAMGLRNPFCIAFQNGTGRLFINDVGSTGTAAREEINDGIAGANYGWALCEGGCGNASFRNPLYFFTHTNNFNAITAGAFYNPQTPLFAAQYVGKYFFGDLATATIQLLDPAATNVTAFATGLSGNLVSMQVGPDGALYYLVQSASSANGGTLGKIIYGVQPLLPFGSSWRYLDTGTNLPPDWVIPTFDDSTWSNGVAQLGFGGNGEVTAIRSTRTDASRITTHYFRKTFVITNTAPYSNFVVSLVRDDGGVVYVNGAEVFRSNMPTGAVTSATFAVLAANAVEEKVMYGALVSPSLLVNGSNWIAAEIHQNATNTTTDLSFDLSLLGLNGNVALRALISGGNFIISYPAWADQFLLESATNLPGAAWTVVDTNGSTVLGGERVVPVSTNGFQQFFRLRSP